MWFGEEGNQHRVKLGREGAEGFHEVDEDGNHTEALVAQQRVVPKVEPVPRHGAAGFLSPKQFPDGPDGIRFQEGKGHMCPTRPRALWRTGGSPVA